MHEFVLAGRAPKPEPGVTAVDVATGPVDHRLRPPPIYLPLIVPEALMIEPSETEAKETLDAFADAMIEIARLAAEDPDRLKQAPTSAPVRRLDEVRAAKRPVLRYRFEEHPDLSGEDRKSDV